MASRRATPGPVHEEGEERQVRRAGAGTPTAPSRPAAVRAPGDAGEQHPEAVGVAEVRSGFEVERGPVVMRRFQSRTKGARRGRRGPRRARRAGAPGSRQASQARAAQRSARYGTSRRTRRRKKARRRRPGRWSVPALRGARAAGAERRRTRARVEAELVDILEHRSMPARARRGRPQTRAAGSPTRRRPARQTRSPWRGRAPGARPEREEARAGEPEHRNRQEDLEGAPVGVAPEEPREVPMRGVAHHRADEGLVGVLRRRGSSD